MEAELDSIYITETLKSKQNVAHKDKEEFQRMKGRMNNVWRVLPKSIITKDKGKICLWFFFRLRKLKSGSTFPENNMPSKTKGSWWFE